MNSWNCVIPCRKEKNMLLLNQRRDALLNVDHVKKLKASYSDEDGNQAEVIAVDQAGTILTVGCYASLYRAKAVLAEIACAYSQYSTYTSTKRFNVQQTPFEPPKVYIMPEE